MQRVAGAALHGEPGHRQVDPLGVQLRGERGGLGGPHGGRELVLDGLLGGVHGLGEARPVLRGDVAQALQRSLQRRLLAGVGAAHLVEGLGVLCGGQRVAECREDGVHIGGLCHGGSSTGGDGEASA